MAGKKEVKEGKQEEEDPNELRDLRAEKRGLQRSVAWLKLENQALRERRRERLEAKEALVKAKQQHQ